MQIWDKYISLPYPRTLGSIASEHLSISGTT